MIHLTVSCTKRTQCVNWAVLQNDEIVVAALSRACKVLDSAKALLLKVPALHGRPTVSGYSHHARSLLLLMQGLFMFTRLLVVDQGASVIH